MHRAKNSCITKLFPCFTISHFKDEIVNYAENENFCKKNQQRLFALLQFRKFHWWKIEIFITNHHLMYLSRTQPTREKINCFVICLLKGRVVSGIMEFDFLVIFYDWTCHASLFFLYYKFHAKNIRWISYERPMWSVWWLLAEKLAWSRQL